MNRKFVEFRNAYDGRPLFVNPDHVTAFEPEMEEKNTTVLHLRGFGEAILVKGNFRVVHGLLGEK